MANSKPLAKFMKKLSNLPINLKNNFAEIQELDREVLAKENLLLKSLGQFSTENLPKNGKLRREQQEKRYGNVMDLLDEMEGSCQKKVDLASVSYETVDKYIIELDKSNQKFLQTLTTAAQTPSTSTEQKKVGRKRKQTIETVESSAESIGYSDYDSPIVEMPVDPNEPTYCFCHQVSFGQMVCCDNKNCTIEWFHFQCVGLTQVPKGKWYCDNCKDKVGGKRGRKPSAPN